MDVDAAVIREVLLESLSHTAAMLPLLFLVFLAMEAVSHTVRSCWLSRAARHKTIGPLVAAALGLLPQCGFSVAATVLWVDGLIPTGSLLASYIATSDEAVPILVSNRDTAAWVLPLLAAKLAWGAAAGVLSNLADLTGASADRQAGALKNPAVSERRAPASETIRISPSGSCVGQTAGFRDYLEHALSRTARIAATVFVLTSVLGLAGHLAEPRIVGFMARQGPWQPVLATAIGLIPSCATSVALAEGFRSGMVSFPALLSGLSANAGIAVLVLLNESRDRKKAALVLAQLALSSCVVGWLSSALVQ